VLHDLDASLEALLRGDVPLPAADVDVSFHAPDRTWASTVTRPTVDLFLFDVARSAEESTSGRHVRQEDGNYSRLNAMARVRLRYLVTAWTTEVRDEHQLLAGVLASLLRTREVPPEYARGAVARVAPLPLLHVGAGDQDQRAELWRSVNGELKPAIELIVTAPVDTTLPVPLPAPPAGVAVRRADRNGGRW
jgi:hypothetical protein